MKISCIIPSYNEEKRIKNVLNIVANCKKIQEIIVIDDGSIDNTVEIIKSFHNIILIKNPENYGKSKSVSIGLKRASGEIILLLDADLEGLNKYNLIALINPVVTNKADISISLRGNAPLLYRKIGLDFISGERVFYKKFLINHLGEIKKLQGFGLESYINSLIIKNNLRIKIVNWSNVISPWKYKKIGIWHGILADLKMSLEILKTIGIWGVLYQIVKLSLLKVK